MKDRILESLNEKDASLTIEQLEALFDINNVEGLQNLLKDLEDLEKEAKIYRTKKNKYMLFDNSHLRSGILIGNKKGFGFVDVEGSEDIFIPASNMNGAIHGDRVIVEVISLNNMGYEGNIIKVLERKLKEVVGEYYLEDNVGKIILDEDKLNFKVIIDLDKSMKAVDGEKVLVRLLDKDAKGIYKGEVVKVLGHKNDPGVDILSISAKYQIASEFSPETMEELKDIPDTVSEEEMSTRTDLRNEAIFTIDGDDTKDIDDAIHIKKLDNGNYELGVHIADVSYYVKENTNLDKDAEERGTSVYLANTVIPMLPHQLSNGICSLNPNVDRLTMSCVMEIDHKGNVVNYDIFESVIKSRIQMTYNKVNAILEKNETVEGYEPYVDDLKLMAELAAVLRKNKTTKGYIDFGIDEAKIITDEDGKAIDIKKRYRGVGENLIEDFMIAANETVATHIYYMELPFVYRVHGEPNEEKIQTFLKFVSILGYKVEGKIKDVRPTTMQRILESLSDKKEYHILSALLLRSMQKAIYDKTNIGHYGLGSKCYTHFTSPIRRYPDTTVHRLLRLYLFKNKIDSETVKFWDYKLPYLTEHCSQKERNSIDCEREVVDMKMAEYMESHIGEEYTGMVSSVMSFGMFIELPNLVEGLVHVNSLKDDHYTYDESTFTLRGNRNKRGYRLGDIVKVKVVAASKDERKIDFVLVGDEDGNKEQES